jgi:hypothetical protein
MPCFDVEGVTANKVSILPTIFDQLFRRYSCAKIVYKPKKAGRKDFVQKSCA